MLLRMVRNEETVFEGHLLYERNRVAVTIEDISNPDDIEVQYFVNNVIGITYLCLLPIFFINHYNMVYYQVVLHSRNSPGQALFSANLGTTRSEAIPIPRNDANGVNYADEAMVIPAAFSAQSGSSVQNLLAANAEIPTTGFK